MSEFTHTPTEDARYSTARNVRVLMALQDVSVIQLAYVLKADKSVIGTKVNGKQNFSDEELEKMGSFFNVVPSERLWTENIEDNPPIKYSKEAKSDQRVEVGAAKDYETPAASSMAAAKSTNRTARQQSVLARLIRQTDEDQAIKKLIEKIYLSVFINQITDLRFYLRANVLVKVTQKYSGAFADDITDEDREGFVEHYLEQYVQWKQEMEDMDEINDIAIAGDQPDQVIEVFRKRVPSVSGWLETEIRRLGNGQEAEKVAFHKLLASVGKAIGDLLEVKEMISVYLNIQNSE